MLAFFGMLAFAAATGAGKTDVNEASSNPHFILEAYPEALQARVEAHNRDLARSASFVTETPSYVVAPTIQRWKLGGNIRVAFSGGNVELYSKVKEAAEEWTRPGIANIKFQFQDEKGNYLSWDTNDTVYKAEVRIAFQSDPNWGGLVSDREAKH
jgi:hypothetical protein